MIVSNTFSQSNQIELKHYLQLDTFSLKNYVLPNLKYDKLDFGLFLNSNNEPYRKLAKKRDEFEINSGIEFSNYSYRNSPRIQFRGNNYLYFDSGYEKKRDTRDDELKKHTGIQSEVSIDNSFRFYNNSKRFFELDINSDINLKKGSYHDFYIRAYNEGITFNANLGFYIGYGRIEDVTDAWKAIRMLKDFKRIGRLSKTPNGNDIITLANSLVKANKFRIFDSRLRRTKQLEFIDSTINNINLITTNDISYFTSLYDIFSIYSNYHPTRNAGNIVSFGVIPQYFIFNNTSEKDDDIMSYGLAFELKNEYYKPINMFFQLDFGYSLSANYNIQKIKNQSLQNSKSIILSPNVFADVSYFPSTRTVFTSKLIMYYLNSLSLDDEIKSDSGSFVSSWHNRMTYYISPRSQIFLNLYLYYIASDTDGYIASFDNYIFYRYANKRIYIKKPSLGKGFTYYFSFNFKYAIF